MAGNFPHSATRCHILLPAVVSLLGRSPVKRSSSGQATATISRPDPTGTPDSRRLRSSGPQDRMADSRVRNGQAIACGKSKTRRCAAPAGAARRQIIHRPRPSVEPDAVGGADVPEAVLPRANDAGQARPRYRSSGAKTATGGTPCGFRSPQAPATGQGRRVRGRMTVPVRTWSGLEISRSKRSSPCPGPTHGQECRVVCPGAPAWTPRCVVGRSVDGSRNRWHCRLNAFIALREVRQDCRETGALASRCTMRQHPEQERANDGSPTIGMGSFLPHLPLPDDRLASSPHLGAGT